MSKQEFIKTQTCVLKVNIQCDCDGCRSKVKKLLLKVDGVYTVSIDAKQGKVTVAGNVDPAVLIQKLEKSGKHAELWGGNKSNNNQFNLATQFKNLQMDPGSGKGGGHKANNNNNNKSQKGGGGGGGGGGGKDPHKDNHNQHQQMQKGGHGGHVPQLFQQQRLQQQHQLNQHQQMKGSKDQKAVKFNLPSHGNNHNHFDDDYDEGDEFDDEDDYDDEDEDGFDDESDEEEEDDFDDVFGQSHNSHAKNIPITGNNVQKNKEHGKAGKDKKSGGGGATKAKKGGGFSLPAIFKSIAGNTDSKKANGGKKGGSGHGNGNGKGGNHNHGSGGGGGGSGGSKHGGKGGGEAKNGGNGGNNKSGGGNNKNGGGNNGGNGHNNGKKGGGGGGGGGGKGGEGFHEMGVPHQNGKGKGTSMGPMGQMANYPMGPMSHNNIPAAHGLPAAGMMMNGVGYYNQGMGPPPLGNPYANQQYMAMMMNQQRMGMGGDAMHPQMMYGRPPPGTAYMPPMPPPPMYDPVTHIFSDENTGGCSIM